MCSFLQNSTELDSKIPDSKNITIATPAPTTTSATPSRDVIAPSRDVRADKSPVREESRVKKEDNVPPEPEVQRYCKARLVALVRVLMDRENHKNFSLSIFLNSWRLQGSLLFQPY